jgi:hypothetical protein
MEGAVSMVESAALEVEKEGGEGLQADEPVQGKGRCGVVGSVVEGRDLVIVPAVVAFLKESPSGGIQGANGL